MRQSTRSLVQERIVILAVALAGCGPSLVKGTPEEDAAADPEPSAGGGGGRQGRGGAGGLGGGAGGLGGGTAGAGGTVDSGGPGGASTGGGGGGGGGGSGGARLDGGATSVADARPGDAGGSGGPADAASSPDAVTPTGQPLAFFVVRDPAALSPPFGDVTMKMRLEAKGYTVAVIDDDSPGLAAQAAGAKLVLVSSSVSSDVVGAQLRDLAIPVICLEPGIYDDMGMTGPTRDADYGYKLMEGHILIMNPTHPMAAALKDTIMVNDQQAMSFGVAPAAEKVASLPASPTQLTLFGYKAGAAMFGALKAPARRVGFPSNDGNSGGLTPEALMLFDAAVDWAVAK
jgi:hypothetical protein